jgi:YspA, cpYpsA-related SLOG family
MTNIDDQMNAETYRVLVTGSREWDDAEALLFELAGMTLLHPGAVVVHGACPSGADKLAGAAAGQLGLPQEPHPADWTGYGKSAGFIRNAEMVALGADLCLAFYKRGAGNKGTNHCASLAEKAGIPVRRVTS